MLPAALAIVGSGSIGVQCRCPLWQCIREQYDRTNTGEARVAPRKAQNREALLDRASANVEAQVGQQMALRAEVACVCDASRSDVHANRERGGKNERVPQRHFSALIAPQCTPDSEF